MQQSSEANGGMGAVDSTLSKFDRDQTVVNNADAEGRSPLGSSGPAECDASMSAGLEAEPCMQGIEFLQNIKNPNNLQPVLLPLQLKLFARIPVVISARLFGQTGKPSETFAQLLVT